MIAIGGEGAGEFSNSDLEQRAQEIAMIDGRAAHEVTDADRAQAREELLGARLDATTGEDRTSDLAMNRDPSEPVSNSGHQTESSSQPEGQQAVENLVNEGVREAEHDQMIADRRRRRTD